MAGPGKYAPKAIPAPQEVEWTGASVSLTVREARPLAVHQSEVDQGVDVARLDFATAAKKSFGFLQPIHLVQNEAQVI